MVYYALLIFELYFHTIFNSNHIIVISRALSYQAHILTLNLTTLKQPKSRYDEVQDCLETDKTQK